MSKVYAKGVELVMTSLYLVTAMDILQKTKSSRL